MPGKRERMRKKSLKKTETSRGRMAEGNQLVIIAVWRESAPSGGVKRQYKKRKIDISTVPLQRLVKKFTGEGPFKKG